MRMVWDSVLVESDSPLVFDIITIAFPLTQQGRPSQSCELGTQYTAWTFPYEPFALPVARHNASLGDKAIG
ncbi:MULTISPECIES: hypothetical protein [unclassified Schlesneria]|uniref:hypothetical protein n=1 Tax=unclassified Schlesneria TaxID=2762017 RepID=UPI002EFC854A